MGASRDEPRNQQKEREEQREGEERQAPSGHVIYHAVLSEGVDELQRPSSALFWSGLAAGLSMGASLIAEGLLGSHLPDEPWKPLITKLGYSVGFIVVILGRQQLFTENTLTPILPLMKEKTWSGFRNVMRLWGVVLAANLLGSLAAAFAASGSGSFDDHVRAEFSSIGQAAMQGSISHHIVKAIFAGWLIALMVWVLPFAESSRLWVIIILSYLVGLGRFGHIIAGASQTFFVAITGQVSWLQVLQNYLLPTFVGNVIGGVTLVAAINHAQIISGKKAMKA